MANEILRVLFTCKMLLLLMLLMMINDHHHHLVTGNIDDNEVSDSPIYRTIQGVTVYQGDRQCLLVGGFCVHTTDCNTPTTVKGLCPSNAHRGVECCYELKTQSNNCEENLGACMYHCAESLVRPGANCPTGQRCCVLV